MMDEGNAYNEGFNDGQKHMKAELLQKLEKLEQIAQVDYLNEDEIQEYYVGKLNLLRELKEFLDGEKK